MKSNKAPGLDGLTVELYRELWGKVNFFLIDVLNKSYDEKLLSFSQRTSFLSLLFKKGIPSLNSTKNVHLFSYFFIVFIY
jgi:RNase P/RNase MRP subunit p30